MLTRPSEKDKGIEIKPISESYFYTWDDELYYFPNDDIRNEWLDWHWNEYQFEDDDKGSDIHGVKVRRVKGEVHSE